MGEKKKYKVTISCSTVLEANNEKEAKRIAKQLWDCGIHTITSIDCDAEESNDCVKHNSIIEALNKMDRYVADELTLCDTERKFPKNEVFIVDDVYEKIAEQLTSMKLSDMTNGEILKTIFPSITEEFNNRPDEILVSGLDVNEEVFQLDWWNKLYKENK